MFQRQSSGTEPADVLILTDATERRNESGKNLKYA